MKHCVEMVRDFQVRNSRLPTRDEITNFPFSLSDQHRNDYFVSTEPRWANVACPTNTAANDDWSLSYFNGHRNITFTSRNNHYDLADELEFPWLVLLVPLFGLTLFYMSYALKDESPNRNSLSAILIDPFLPSPITLPKELLEQLKSFVERPLYNLWRAGMIVPVCFAAAYWIIIHMMFGGDEINTRSWCLLVGGGCIAVLSILLSRRLGPIKKLLWGGLTVLAYPLLFAGAMFIGFLMDFVHCFGVGWQ
jgi:hypothetical protein